MSKLTKKTKCRVCGHVKEEQLTCNDCTYSFINPFDDLICEKIKTGNRLCKEFKLRK